MDAGMRGRRFDYVILIAILLLAAALRLGGLRHAGVTHLDDLRAYAGPQIVEMLTAPDVPLSRRISNAHRVSVDGTGARPALAWLLLIPAMLGFSSIGDLFIPFALFGVLTVYALWVFCRRWLDRTTAIYAALWLAVSATHVNYSRSALPPTPAMTLMVLGLVILVGIGDPGGAPPRGRLFLVGLCFALATAFHPAYVVYALVPWFWLSMVLIRQRPGTAALISGIARQGALLIVPTAILVLLYDAPRVVLRIFLRQFDSSDLVYLDGLWRLFRSPTVYGVHEGFLFWPRYLLASEGIVGVLIISTGLLSLVLFGGRSKHERTYSLVLWLLLPFTIYSAWPDLNSYGRLYSPLLPALACCIGLGASRLIAAMSRFASSLSVPAAIVVMVVFVGAGLFASAPIIAFPGREPAVGRYMQQTGLTQAMGFFRTDLRALAPVQVHMVSNPADIERMRCQPRMNLLLISPATFDYVLSYKSYFFEYLRLQPLFTYRNPFTVPGRLMEGEIGIPGHARRSVLTDPDLARLGLFRVGRAETCN